MEKLLPLTFVSMFLQGQKFTALVSKLGKTMHCRNGRDHRGKCDDVRWLFHRPLPEGDQELSRGRIITHPEDKSYRLSVTEECSLVIRDFTFDDAGYYSCKNSHIYLQPITELTVLTSEYLYCNAFTLK